MQLIFHGHGTIFFFSLDLYLFRPVRGKCNLKSNFKRSNFKKICLSLSESPPAVLKNYFCHFILEIQKTHAEECEPNSLTISETRFSRI